MKKFLSLLLGTIVITSALTDCNQKETSSVSTDGSTSMQDVINILGEAYAENHKDVKEGRCDIGLSGRALKEDEKAAGLEETVLAYDGIAIIVHPDNPVTNLSTEQIAQIYKGEITNWKDVGEEDREIVAIGCEAGSGTRDGFETITGTKDSCKYRQELTSTGDVITTVSQNPNTVGYASVAALKDSVKALSVNNAVPSESTIKDGSYNVQRPFVPVTMKDKKLSDTAQDFFNYITSDKASELISSAGIVPAN